MFTGIITEIGAVSSVAKQKKNIRFSISAKNSSRQLKVSDSVSINGVCHTVVSRKGSRFDVESVAETIKKTSMGGLKAGSKVNLELPMPASGRFDGHIVQGHVDTAGKILAIESRAGSSMFTIGFPAKFSANVVPVGSIAVDGVSLTVAEVKKNAVVVAIIPHTMENTVFRYYKIGTLVNIEFDILGKYIARLVNGDKPNGRI